jgi:hypothetical protein
MSGRPRIKVYEYDFKGRYLGYYESMAEARKNHYPSDIAIRPMFLKKELGVEYQITPNDTILFKQRVYRDDVVYIVKIENSKLCNICAYKDEPVEMLNIKNEVIAVFPNCNVATIILPDLSHKIYHDINHKRVKRHETYDFYFRKKLVKNGKEKKNFSDR